jgi:hypothetical protein
VSAVVSRNTITAECAEFQTVERHVLRPISDRAYAFGGGETPPTDVITSGWARIRYYRDAA